MRPAEQSGRGHDRSRTCSRGRAALSTSPRMDDVIGTVAGDDTIFVATPDEVAAAARLAGEWTATTTAEVGTRHDN